MGIIIYNHCNQSTRVCMCKCMRPFHMFHRSGWRKPLLHILSQKKGILIRQGQGPGAWYNSQGIYMYLYIYKHYWFQLRWLCRYIMSIYICISHYKCYQAHLCFQNQRLSMNVHFCCCLLPFSQVMIKREASPLPRYVVYLMLNWRDTPPWN